MKRQKVFVAAIVNAGYRVPKLGRSKSMADYEICYVFSDHVEAVLAVNAANYDMCKRYGIVPRPDPGLPGSYDELISLLEARALEEKDLEIIYVFAREMYDSHKDVLF